MPYLVEHPIRVEELIRTVLAPGRGGIATFLGLVRDHHAGHQVLRLKYSAYGPMAEAECAAIVAEAERRWGAGVALEHRVGSLAVGDAAVGIVVAAAHRGEAFDGCRWIIDEVKRRVPIWKKEFYDDGSIAWVDPTATGGSVPAGAPDA